MEFRPAAPVLSSSSLSSTASGAGPDHFPTPAGGGGPIQAEPAIICELGRRPYEPTWRDMQAFTSARGSSSRDELWVVEHPPVYTLGLAARNEHLPRSDNGIPVVRTDRGGQITYHGPGQAIVYCLVDIARRGIKVRDMVCLLEQAAIDVLAAHGIAAERRPGAPGVYAADGNSRGAKIAALGLKVKRQGCYHGISLNVDMDLSPFAAINPCGYPGLAVTSLRELGVTQSTQAVSAELAQRIGLLLEQAAHDRSCA